MASPSTDNFHIITGGPGSGKSTLIDALAVAGVATSAEVGRRIIRQQLDRGVPDVVGFLRVSGLPVPPAIDVAARATRYNLRVFLALFWAAIYAHDAERKQAPDLAAATEAVMRGTYADYGYTLVELPRAPVAERVAFVRRHL